jgi:predicted dinucleotide-binding enzyme
MQHVNEDAIRSCSTFRSPIRINALLPGSADYVKSFGMLGADALASGASRELRRAVLFYATDDEAGALTNERLIRVAGFEPLKAGGFADVGRIEGPGGDLVSCRDLERRQRLAQRAPGRAQRGPDRLVGVVEVRGLNVVWIVGR